MTYSIRRMADTDWPEVSRIYQEGLDTGNATLLPVCPAWKEWNTSYLNEPRLVILDDEKVIGWAALTAVTGCCAYAGVAEVSIYIDEKHRRKGAGKQLLIELIHQAELCGFWTLQSGILQENKASIRLHERCGFRLVGYRLRLGRDRGGNWRNIVLMEKRSPNDHLFAECACDSECACDAGCSCKK